MTEQPSQHVLAPSRARTGEDPLLSFFKATRGGPVTLSCTEVQRLDSLRLQTLLVAHRQWSVDAQGFAVDGMSDQFRAGLERLGVAPDHFDKDALQ